jgi:Domain of unknown function (DUF4123)
MQVFISAAVQHNSCNWYAIADSAQHKSLPAAISKDNYQQRCLLDAPPGSPLAAASPHLVQISKPDADNAAWKWIQRHAPSLPCVTVIASELNFDQLFEHLKPFTEVLLPDGYDMFFAFWDPAILSTLVGQADDATLYVKGPVLNAHQRVALMQGLAGWWYWDREGAVHSLEIEVQPNVLTEKLDLPLQLTQQQVDDLVEANVPDIVIHNINENQPHLFNQVPNAKRHSYVRQMLPAAREIGLEGMRDLTNFVSLGLIYRKRFTTEPLIQELLMQVHQKIITMDKAMELMPE